MTTKCPLASSSLYLRASCGGSCKKGPVFSDEDCEAHFSCRDSKLRGRQFWRTPTGIERCTATTPVPGRTLAMCRASRSHSSPPPITSMSCRSAWFISIYHVMMSRMLTTNADVQKTGWTCRKLFSVLPTEKPQSRGAEWSDQLSDPTQTRTSTVYICWAFGNTIIYITESWLALSKISTQVNLLSVIGYKTSTKSCWLSCSVVEVVLLEHKYFALLRCFPRSSGRTNRTLGESLPAQ